MSARNPAQVAATDQAAAAIDAHLDYMLTKARETLAVSPDRGAAMVAIAQAAQAADPEKVALVAAAALVRLAEQGGEPR